MKAFITTGTENVLQPIIDQHPQFDIIKLQAGSELTLYYEANDDSIFQSAQTYTILESTNSFTQSGFVVMYHIAVLEDKEIVFTKRARQTLLSLNNTNGFTSYRLLKRINEMGFVICIQWDTRTSFNDWTNSKDFTGSVLDESSNHNNIFRPPYTKTFTVVSE